MSDAVAPVVSERLDVLGIVQGVGFRPFVYRAATQLGLRGFVGNDSTRVFIEVTGPVERIDELVRLLRDDAPPLAHVETIHRRRVAPTSPHSGFDVVESETTAGARALVPPATAVCHECRHELLDETDRRYRHPFITCTNCGPRFTIITALPYDRPNTTMASFPMCERCAAEYNDPSNRRYHAQPISCHDCGPELSFIGPDGHRDGGHEAIDRAAELLRKNGIVAIKGLGGFHLAVDATDPSAVDRLRTRKHRPDKPLAVMVRDIEAVRRIAHVSPSEEQVLSSAARPVVLLERRDNAGLAESVAPNNPFVGVMLAYTPIHHLLLEDIDTPVVMTSANISGEPIIYRDGEIASQLGTVADGLLTHDRPIVAPCDDSVVRVVGQGPLPVRRARGYAPIPVKLNGAHRHVLAVGGELKNTFCVGDGAHAWVSPHVGDMGSLATLQTFEQGIARFAAMYDVEPTVTAADAHPAYLSSRWAHRTSGTPVLEVQHHHAHIAAVMAEHQLEPTCPVLGFAFDGTGYGDDGTIWGGEVLEATADGYNRLAHLVPVPLPGGDAAVEHPARIALAHLHAAGIEWTDGLAPVAVTPSTERTLLARQLETEFGCVPTTSMGRLFDAVASILALRHRISFEAQAAIDLEHAARRNRSPHRHYSFGLGNATIDQRPVLRSIVDDVQHGYATEVIADGFHHAVVDAIVALAHRHLAPGQVAVLSGGVFQNSLLAQRTVASLSSAGHEVRTHRLVPPNDGGLALGQAYIATHAQPSKEH